MRKSVVLAFVSLTLVLASFPGPAARIAVDPDPIERLRAEIGSGAQVALHPLSDRARFVRVPPGRRTLGTGDPAEQAREFLARQGAAFGIEDPARDLTPPETRRDRYGWTRLTYRQLHRGVPVFGAALRVHFDAAGRLAVINGTLLPDLDLEVAPLVPAEVAGREALREVEATPDASPGGTLSIRATRLVVYRPRLARRQAGPALLAWEAEIAGGGAVREFVFVDARRGSVVERLPGIRETLSRQVHEPNFPGNVIWGEGDTLPYTTGNAANDDQVNTLIEQAGSAYDLFQNLSGGTHPSWDAMSGTMHSIWNPINVACPNAIWNGTTTVFCNGTAGDDIVAHEWTHAYTESNADLIYQAQPGALNEAYSDIFGELIDLRNGAGTDAPAPARAPGDCSTFGGVPSPDLEVTAPAALAGHYSAGGALFNPPGAVQASGALQLVNDGVNNGGASSFTDGCEPLVGFTPGRIAIADRGTCGFLAKAANAQNAGAAGLIVVNNTDSVITMGGTLPGITIPSVIVGLGDGAALKAQPAGSVQATLRLRAATAASYRWLIGEDASALGPIRDLWTPECFGQPGRVGAPQYFCGPGDNDGVHANSGVPNHAFALLVDGGTFNGHVVAPLGATKAAHIYWRAMTTYQVPDTDFADHADALTQSCEDLLGIDLADLDTGAASGEILDGFDCAQVAEAIDAVELRAQPGCASTTLLSPNPPALLCEAVAFEDELETDPDGRWDFANQGVFPEYEPRDWVWTAEPPPGASGSALFATDDREIGNCIPGFGDQSRRMTADTPAFIVDGPPILAFDHYVATEFPVDGGNIKISVNGGPFLALAPGDFIFNGYNAQLTPPSAQNANPLAGQVAFSGSDGGTIAGSWGRSLVSLAGHAVAGDTVRVRFEFGADGCSGLDGWYLDNVLVCSAGVLPGRPAHFSQVTDTTLPVLADMSNNYAGAAWIDYDGDGDLDLFVSQEFLYRNDGRGSFVRVPAAIGVGLPTAVGYGTTWGDYDNDGDIDVYTASALSYLYANDGAGGFSRVVTGAIGQGSANHGWTAAWGDYDNDGNLDLAVTNPAIFVPAGSLTNHLFHNGGPPSYAFSPVGGPIVTGRAPYTVGTWADFDDDGDIDFFIGAGPADGTTAPDYLYRNLLTETGQATFERITEAPLATDLQDGQLWNWIDYDNDGDLDAYVTNWGGPLGGLPNRLYRNDGNGFTSIQTGSIVTDADISLSSVWGDFDNDGDLDCFVANDGNQQDRYYSNNGDGTFTGEVNGLGLFLPHRGAAAGDFDGDGDLDLYVDGPAGARRLFRNSTSNGNHWLEVRLQGVVSNRSAIGAKVRARATIGGQATRLRRDVSAQNNFNDQNSLEVHFGLGAATEVEELVVEWPSGIVQTRRGVAIDQLLDVTENTAAVAIPDGTGVPGTAMVADRVQDEVRITWDQETCPAVAVNVYHGAIGDFSTVAGGTCGLPGTGTALVTLPDDAWFLVAATDGLVTDGSWGAGVGGAERDLEGTSAACPAIIEHATGGAACAAVPAR